MSDRFTHKLMFALRVTDATDGSPLGGGLRFTSGGEMCRPVVKPDGYHVFTGNMLPQKTEWVDVWASGYEIARVRVAEYETEVSGAMPIANVEMIPAGNGRAPYACRTLAGIASGLTEIDAIEPGGSDCFFRTFDPRGNRLGIYNPRKTGLNRVRYALSEPDASRYEVFRVVARVSDEVFEIDRPLTMAADERFPIHPVVRGDVREDGSYILRIRGQTGGRRLVRFSSAETARFRIVDFSGDADPPGDDALSGAEA